MHLHRLIADSVHRRGSIRHDEAFRLAFVPAGEDGRMIAVGEKQAHEVRRHRRLTRSAYREVSHAYRRDIHRVRTQQMMVVQAMPDPHTELEQPTKRYCN